MNKNIAVIFGGQSSEYDISLASAAYVLNNIDKTKYGVYPIGISKEGLWYEYTGSIDKIEDGSWINDEYYKIPDGERVLFNKEVDVVFPLLHGFCGEDGTIQGLCKLLRLPCVGASVLSSALCMDKAYSKYILEDFNINVTPYEVIEEREYLNNKSSYKEKVIKKLGEEVFVKPSNGGSSVGVSKLKAEDSFEVAIEKAFKYDKRVLVEKAIAAREIKVAIIEDGIELKTKIGEVVYKNSNKEFYDYEVKYTEGMNELIVPAKLETEVMDKIEALALKAYKVLDCRGMARVDFFIDRYTSEIYLNEINTIPGFTRFSSFPKLWEVAGVTPTELINILIKNAE
ncbi:D-alanine--D-alanine ligase family protein [Clostridium cellulovorans]|uniref:D-alanine--D-alanine ligase n=1 Tax=Clostridium cellulovorans (strain ATCC 35296 / DSM 3052 / OCM 3 / 743B) TaxID=573061 RepID=D9STP1_CLOC7|nr:D-alanine--D-alanine ligase family protein [Clostridium cellulovorans]ADL52775.1 D-alanine/D-alanine ligase [Clostridium cellulovorans 743B]